MGGFGIEALVLRVKLTKQYDETTRRNSVSLFAQFISPLIQNPVKIRLSVQTNQTTRRNNATKQRLSVCYFFCYFTRKKKTGRHNQTIKGALESNETKPICLNKTNCRCLHKPALTCLLEWRAAATLHAGKGDFDKSPCLSSFLSNWYWIINSVWTYLYTIYLWLFSGAWFTQNQ